MISPDIQLPEEEVIDTPDSMPPIPLRRSKSMAESIAFNTHANCIPLEQVVSTWGQQRGMYFVDEILASPVHSNISEKEKDRLRREAAKAIARNWIERQGFTVTPLLRHDRIYPFWNVGWKM